MQAKGLAHKDEREETMTKDKENPKLKTTLSQSGLSDLLCREAQGAYAEMTPGQWYYSLGLAGNIFDPMVKGGFLEAKDNPTMEGLAYRKPREA